MSLETLRIESKKTVRRPVAKVIVTWTDPLIDLSLDTEESEENRVSYPIQVADNVTDVPRKWFHTNDTDVTLDGTWYPMPGTLTEARESQVGWWGTQNADGSGDFVGSTPTISVSFSRRLVETYTVTGESALSEYPVDFKVKVYNTEGGVYVLAETVTISGNSLLTVSGDFVNSHPYATRITLEVTKWSTAGKIIKIVEFYTSVVETFESDDILYVNILKEFQGTEGTLPVGNISCNELDLKLQNITDRFFSGNTGSDISTFIKRNRKIEPFLGFRYANGTTEYVPMGLYWSGDWLVADLDTGAQTTARDRFELMRKKQFPYDEVFTETLTDASLTNILTQVLDSFVLYMYDFYYDLSGLDTDYVLPYFDPEFFKKKSYFDVVKDLAAALLAYAYMDTPTDAETTANGPLNKDMLRFKSVEAVFPSSVYPSDAIQITKDDFIDKMQPADTESMANTIDVPYQVFTEGEAEESVATVSDPDSISEYGIMEYVYESTDLIQEASHAEDVANSLITSFKVPRRDIEVETFGDITLNLTDQVSVPEYQKNSIDKRGIFAVTRLNALYNGSLRIALRGRKLVDDNSAIEHEGRGLLAQPSVDGLSGVMSFPAIHEGEQDLSGYDVEPLTIGRVADTYVVPDAPLVPYRFILTFDDATTHEEPTTASREITIADVDGALSVAGKYRPDVVHVEVTEGIQRIGAGAFENLVVASGGVIFPSTLESIGEDAFKGFASTLYNDGGCPPAIFHEGSYVVFDNLSVGVESETFKTNAINGHQILPAGRPAVVGAFVDNILMTDVTFRNRTDEIQSGVFTGCLVLDNITFEQNTVPSVVETSGFGWIGPGTNVKIYVPTTGDSLSAWKASLYAISMGTVITHINDVPIGDIV